MNAKLSARVAIGMIVATLTITAVHSADFVALPQQQSQGNVIFVSGGVGDDEATALKRAAPGYPLELLLVQHAVPRDEYLADVKIKILNSANSVVLDALSGGPIFLAQLPSGTYQIEADNDGIVQRRTVEVRNGKHTRAVFVWTRLESNRNAVSAEWRN